VQTKLHWVLDVWFLEHQSRAQSGCAAENLATLRRLALNLLKRERTKRPGIKGKQLNADYGSSEVCFGCCFPREMIQQP
jgi:hypothetical protein